MEEIHKAKYLGRVSELSKTCLLGILWSLNYTGMIGHWWLNSISNHSPLEEVQEWD